MGIDPGTTIMGYGVLRVQGTKPEMVAMGIIDLRKYRDHYLKLRHIHGLPLDLSLAGYFSVIPGFLFLASSCALSDVLRKIWNIYYLILSILLSMIFTIDLALYEYWGFRLDATPLFYFFSSPKDAIASVSLSVVFVGIGVMLVYAGVLYLIFYFVQRSIWRGLKLPFHYLKVAGILLLVTGLLFIPIRGGFTVSTMNVGKVYFSPNQRLNHVYLELLSGILITRR